MKRTRHFNWTPAWEDLLREHYPNLQSKVIAQAIGVPVKAVYQKARSLGLAKSAAFYQAENSGRILRGRTDPRMVASQFQKGLTPWNKGTKGVVGVQEACRATQFKKGSKPHNTHAVGSYRINREGHLQQKIGEAKGSNSMRWRGVAEILWCKANGPVPAGHMVAFKPGMFTNKLELITLDRVECISRADNLRRNSHHGKSPELSKLIQLKGAITRQVNRIAREARERNSQ